MDNIPKKIFIIPYRDRLQHKSIFLNQYKHLLEDQSYEMFFVHQFNRLILAPTFFNFFSIFS